MNKTYIPNGLTVTHNEVNTDTLIVNGTLIVKGQIHCKRIIGNGYFCSKHYLR